MKTAKMIKIDHESQDDDDKDLDNGKTNHDDQDDDDKDHDIDEIGYDDQDTSNDDIARQFPIASIRFTSNLDQYFSHPTQTFPTLKAGQKALHEISKSEGFTVKKNYEKNADKIEGECSQQTNKEFSKIVHS